MAKKYLTLEEAAVRLNVKKEVLVKRREDGELRGFADRGNWKFKVDDIEELARTMQPDSDPEVPIIDTGESGFLDPESNLALGGESAMVMGPGDSGLLKDSGDLSDLDLDGFGEGLESSDSDVRLVMDSDLAPEAGSDPELSLAPTDDSDSDINLIEDEAGDSDSDVMLVGGESDMIGASSDLGDTLADSGSDISLVGDSDSDVKLVDDESDSDSDVNLIDTADSGSDIQLAPVEGDAPVNPNDVTDSDVNLIGDVESDSDIQLSAEDLGGTDSDVRLVADDSGSDISLAPLDLGSDSDVRLVAEPIADGSDSDVQLIDSSEIDSQTSDSDIALISSDDSAIALDLGGDSDDSGSVLADESGIALGGGSSITLASESGISLEGPADSGISLDFDDEGITLADEGDSGISIGDAGDSSITLGKDADFGGTMPMMDAVDTDDENVPETQFEIPSLSDEDTGVIDLDSSDEQTAVIDSLDSSEFDDAAFDIDDEDSAEMDALSDELELDDDFDDDTDMDELDVFEDDGDFEEGFESGASHGELPVAAARMVPMETEWGTGTFVSLIASTSLLALLGVVMADLIRSMWAYQDASAVGGAVLNMLGSLYK